MTIEDEVVRKAPLFTALDDAAAASLRTSMDSVKINKGAILFKEGDSGEHVYVIVEGKLKLGTSSGDGRENLLSILESLAVDEFRLLQELGVNVEPSLDCRIDEADDQIVQRRFDGLLVSK